MVPALVNHLWQSTIFAAVVALLTLALKTNHARTRYWLWLAASLKFLVPFSILVTLGRYLGAAFVPHTMQPAWMLVTDEISRPFPQATAYSMSTETVHLALFNMRLILGAVWLCGFVAILYSWMKKWRRISEVVRASKPLREGRELDSMRRLQHTAGIAATVELASSNASLEPGVFGIVRPVLLLPAGISDHLSDAQLEAIFAHELCHIRWRDNLSAAAHMFIEAVFWFHPLVWWLGSRLVDERERACDEDVLRLGSEPGVYAESILRTCKFYLESPLVCVAGITGSNLKRRIEGIMMHRPALPLYTGKKLLLCAAAISALAAPVTIGILNAPLARAHSGTPDAISFEAASIKPNNSGSHKVQLLRSPDGHLTMTNTTLQELITFAYNLRDRQISGAPNWMNSERYDIAAMAAGSASEEQLRRMTQVLLAERFRLAAHRETKELPVYELLAGKSGPMLHASETPPANGPYQAGLRLRPGGIEGSSVSMSMLARGLSDLTGRTVVDRTGLNGTFDFKVTAANGSSSVPSIFTAVQEQLGLTIEVQKGPVEILVIDHVEKATAN